jgi:glycosyltransferase involved in cell wall biosynthesis
MVLLPRILILTCHPLNDARILKHWRLISQSYANSRLYAIKWLASQQAYSQENNVNTYDFSHYNKYKKRARLLWGKLREELISLIEETHNEHPLILHLHDPVLIPLACALKHKHGRVKIIYDKHEYHSFALNNIPSIEMIAYEKIFRNHIDGVVVVTEEMLYETKKSTRNSMPIEIVPNYPLKTMFDDEIIKQKIDSEDAKEIRFIYFGSLSNYDRNISLILNCSEKILQSFSYAKVFIGGRNISQKDLQQAEELERKYPKAFYYTGEVSYETVMNETSKAHFGFLALAPQSNKIYKNKTISSNKIYEYLLSGTIPLLSLEGIPLDIPSEFYITLEEDYISKIEKVISNKALRLKIQKYAEKFSWENASLNYHKIYNTVAKV